MTNEQENTMKLRIELSVDIAEATDPATFTSEVTDAVAEAVHYTRGVIGDPVVSEIQMVEE